MGQRFSSHPFLDVLSLPQEIRRAFRLGRVNPVLQHLTDPAGRVRPVGPLADPSDPVSLRAHMLEVAGRLGQSQGAPTPSPRGHGLGDRSVEAGRTSIVVLSDDSRSTMRSAASVVRHADGQDIEVVVVDRGLPPHVVLGLHAWACAWVSATPRSVAGGWAWTDGGSTRLVVLDQVVEADLATVVESAVRHCTGDIAVVLDASCEVRRGWLAPLIAPLGVPHVTAVQPLLLQTDDTIASAGMSDVGAPLLVGHPKEDALRLAGVPVPAISDLAVALRTADGWAADRTPDSLRVAPSSWVSTSSTAVGLRSSSEGGVSTSSTAVEFSTALRSGTRTAGQPRWSIKLPSPPGSLGDAWGDAHFADSFATALRRLGQDVVTRRRGAHTAGPTHLDDVSLALRGVHPISPTPGQCNVLWVISHPEDVDPREFEGYVVVCAASTEWSEEMSVRTGREVVPLLQASEFQRPAGATLTSGTEATVVFVGNNLGKRERPLVWQAVAAGVPLSVYGPGWEDLPVGVWQGEYVPNGRLPDLYRRHGIVLADHWPDMARHGFIANRVFDAVASGARVISDDVVGLHDVFDVRDVVVARTPDEIQDAVGDLRAGLTQASGPPASLSFDDRAALLVDLVSRHGVGG